MAAGLRGASTLAATLLCVAGTARAGAPTADAPSAWIDYLHIEANEGGSSGGHAAIRFGRRTYHFQNRDGLLRLLREDSHRFLHDYALLDNRDIHVSRIAVTDDVSRRLRERFEARRHAQTRQLALRDALEREVRLLERLHARARGRDAGDDGLLVRGAGYFRPAASPGEPAPALLDLRERLGARHGAGFLEGRRRAVLRALAALRPEATPPPPGALATYEPPPPAYGFGDRYADLLSALAALEVLDDARPLRRDALVRGRDDALRLGEPDVRALRRFAARLEAELLRLAASPRDDRGFPLLVGMARRLAIEASLRESRLVLLDAFDEGAPELDAAAVSARAEILAPILAEARADLDAARERFRAAPLPGERDFAALEEAGNRFAELARAARRGGPLRVQRGRLLPARAAPQRDLPLPTADAASLASLVARARARRDDYARTLRDAQGYHLIAGNCVSEIFATLHSAFADPRADSVRSLGGWIDPGRSLAFIPFAASAAVRRHYRVRETGRVPSYRHARLDEMARREPPPWVALRESNTLTAMAYRRSPLDSFFLFFTDGALPLRPLLGAFNLVAGAGQTAFGLVRAPFDRGDTLVSGLRGVAMSLPELVFVNLRKGSNEYIPPEQRFDPEAPGTLWTASGRGAHGEHRRAATPGAPGDRCGSPGRPACTR